MVWCVFCIFFFFFFSSRRRHTRWPRDWSSDVCSSDLSCLTLSGAAADAMPRNLGWDLTEVGRKIERTLSLLALVRATLGRRRTRAAEARIAGAVASVTESGASYRRS